MKITIEPRRFCPRPIADAALARPPRGPGKRVRPDIKAAESGQLSDAQLEFVSAIGVYKKLNRTNFPTFSEILEVLRALGYRKVLPRAIALDAPEPPLEI